MLRLGCFVALVAGAVGAWMFRAPLGRAVSRFVGREAPLPRVFAHQPLVRDTIRAADLVDRRCAGRQVEGPGQIGEHVADRDRLGERTHPARDDHHGQPLDQRAHHLERQAARADDDRRAQLDHLADKLGKGSARDLAWGEIREHFLSSKALQASAQPTAEPKQSAIQR